MDYSCTAILCECLRIKISQILEVMATELSQNAAFMDLYSRQIGAYGIETMGKLVKMNVLIVGLKGVGIEAAKNLILAGPGGVTLHDDEATEVLYFYITLYVLIIYSSKISVPTFS